MTRAVVAGGGVVGLTTALSLRAAGFDVLVTEQAPDLRTAGATLGIWRNALDVLDVLGAGDSVRAIGVDAEMWFHDPAGRPLPTPDFGPSDHSYLLVHRARLTDVLADAVGRDAIRLDARLTGYEEHADGVTARYADGSSEDADLLVGADGLYSRVRTQLSPDAAAREHTGHYAWRALIDPGTIPVERDVLVIGHQRTRGGYARTSGGQALWLLAQFGSEPPTGSRRAEALRRAVHLDDGGWNSALAELIAATPDDQILQNQIMIVPPVPRWTSDRVVLVGDAAHAMSPHVTAGASLGMQDAALLGHCLRVCPDIPAALRAYEADRIARYEQVRVRADAVEAAGTPEEFARQYAAFSHWMITS
jgi:2-polyprenyl-6-methoxyphenol hydroxylase-like FAD-dependent oxidoreductase